MYGFIENKLILKTKIHIFLNGCKLEIDHMQRTWISKFSHFCKCGWTRFLVKSNAKLSCLIWINPQFISKTLQSIRSFFSKLRYMCQTDLRCQVTNVLNDIRHSKLCVLSYERNWKKNKTSFRLWIIKMCSTKIFILRAL